jgi:hypothetical protein
VVIQFVLTLGLALSLFYALIQDAATRLLRISMSVVVLAGTLLVWFPDETMVIARLLGVGRGADLIAYCWIVVSILLILILHLRTVRMKGALTDLTRHIALADAEKRQPRMPADGQVNSSMT